MTVVGEDDHTEEGRGRPERVPVDYERAVSQASELIVAHLIARPRDAELSGSRHAEGETLYAAVVTTFPEIERMRLTSLMWDQAVNQALAVVGNPPAPGDS